MHFPYATPRALPGASAFRGSVRRFIAQQRDAGVFAPKSNSWTDVNRAFSEACGSQGYIGITWPKTYGGGERPQMEQFIVVEEMLAAGAPVGGHWLADRQSGPQILKFGTEAARRRIIPQIVAGKACFAIGMSEPNSGSDLASVATRAERADGGWRIHGRKVWTTNAHNAQYMNVLCRTDKDARRQKGLSQMIVALPDPAVVIRPIHNISGRHEFNEVLFDGCFVPDAMVLGEPGDGWSIVTDELALERSGPDRYMSSFPLLAELIDAAAAQRAQENSAELSAAGLREVGQLIAETITLRQMSLCVAGAIERGDKPNVQAALVKELGAVLEQETPEAVRRVMQGEAALSYPASLTSHLQQVTHDAPSFSLRGGTREILRGIIAKNLGTL